MLSHYLVSKNLHENYALKQLLFPAMMFCRCDLEEKSPSLFQSPGQLLVQMTSHEFFILKQTNKMFDLTAGS